MLNRFCFLLQLAAAACFTWLVLSASQARSAQAEAEPMTSTFKVNLADPESSVPSTEQANRNPLEMGYFLMDLATYAESAEKRHDYADAIKFYKAMAKAVPERSISYTKQCAAYEAMGDRVRAADVCWDALGYSGIELRDFEHYVRLVLAGSDKLAKRDVGRIDEVIAHLRTQTENPQAVLSASMLACELGVRLEDAKRLEACTQQLGELAPKDAKTLTFRWALALLHQDVREAERVIADAQRAKVPRAVLAKMRAGLDDVHSAARLRMLSTRVAPAGGLALLLGAFGWLATRRRAQRPAQA